MENSKLLRIHNDIHIVSNLMYEQTVKDHSNTLANICLENG